jgi:hypothetical protein
MARAPCGLPATAAYATVPTPPQPFLAALLTLLGCGDRFADAAWRARLAALLTPGRRAWDARAQPARPLAVALATPWRLLPRLVLELGADDDQRAVLQQWCDERVQRATAGGAAAVGDLSAATAAFLLELWHIAAGARLPPGHAAGVRAQVATALDDPKLHCLPAEDRQHCWELCVGLHSVFAGFQAAAADGNAANSVRLAAQAALAGLLGVPSDELAVGPAGFHRRAQAEMHG